MNGLLTDLYELTMAAGYFEAGKAAEKATFEFTIRRLPAQPQFRRHRRHSRRSSTTCSTSASPPRKSTTCAACRSSPRVARPSSITSATSASPAISSPSPKAPSLFAGEPVLTVRAPIIEAQIPETYLLSAVTFQTLIATKAARCVDAAAGRPVVEFGTRRAHTPEAGVLGARAAYIGGCAGTSNTLAGFRYGIPVMGTAAHSWVMSFPCETGRLPQAPARARRCHRATASTPTTPLEGARRAAKLGGPLWGVRLDSGDFDALSRQVRAILDEAGHTDAKIMVSGDLDEYRIRELVAAGAPIDSFGVGTQLATCADAPNMGAIYKMVELEICGIKRFTAKYSDDKTSVPGAKQVFRDVARDVIARSGECGKGEALLRPIILGGRLDRAAAHPRAGPRACRTVHRATAPGSARIGRWRSRGR